MRHPFTEIIFAKCLKIRICYFIGTHFVKVRKKIFSSIELGANGYQYNKHALMKLPVLLSYDNSLTTDDSLFYNLYKLNDEEIELIENYIAEVRLR